MIIATAWFFWCPAGAQTFIGLHYLSPVHPTLLSTVMPQQRQHKTERTWWRSGLNIVYSLTYSLILKLVSVVLKYCDNCDSSNITEIAGLNYSTFMNVSLFTTTNVPDSEDVWLELQKTGFAVLVHKKNILFLKRCVKTSQQDFIFFICWSQAKKKVTISICTTHRCGSWFFWSYQQKKQGKQGNYITASQTWKCCFRCWITTPLYTL